MGDVVTCKAVLNRAADRSLPDHLMLDTGKLPYPDVRYIPCRPLGEPRKAGGEPEWEYEERGGRLHLTPSLLCPDTPEPHFHTDFHWSCAFVVCPEDGDVFKLFRELNPGE